VIADSCKCIVDNISQDLVKTNHEGLFVGVDEYDAPANSCLFSGGPKGRLRFNEVAELFKTQFFAVMKQAMGSIVKKYWLTGVLPAFRDGISPLSATRIISTLPEYNGVCGLTEDEVYTIAKTYLASTHTAVQLDAVFQDLKRWYNGYRFSCSSRDKLPTQYNPQLVFTHLRALQGNYGINPFEEVNAIHTATVLEAIGTDPELPFEEFYLSAVAGKLEMEVMTEFGAAELRQVGKHKKITGSLLYYFGVFTYGKERRGLRIPNVTMQHLVRLYNSIPFLYVSDKLGRRLPGASENS
jgi:hypothetical protein